MNRRLVAYFLIGWLTAPGSALAAADSNELLARGEKLLAAGDTAKACPIFADVVRTQPNDSRGYYFRAVCRERAGQTKEAEADYRLSIARMPLLAEAHNNLALIVVQRNDRAAALALLEKAVQLRADYGEAWFNLGVVRLQSNAIGPSLSAFEQAVRLQPNDIDTRVNYAAALERAEKPKEALKQLELAATRAPDDEELQISYANVLGRQQQFARAEAHLKQRIAAKPSAELHCALGKIYRHQGKNELAIVEYRRAIAKDPAHARSYLLLSMALGESGQCDQAQAALKKFAALAPAADRKKLAALERQLCKSPTHPVTP